jgi:hypothetical protein
MVETKRDPAVGKAMIAWWALQGDEPIEYVQEYLIDARKELDSLINRRRRELGPVDEETLSGLSLVLYALSLAFKAEEVAYKLQFKRRTRGKPINKLDRAHLEHRAALLVERLVDQGVKQEAALEQAKQETGVSRSEVLARMKGRKALRELVRRQRESA